MIVAKDCQFYEGNRQCSALKEQDCFQCSFYKKKIAQNVEEAIELYLIKKNQQKAMEGKHGSN